MRGRVRSLIFETYRHSLRAMVRCLGVEATFRLTCRFLRSLPPRQALALTWLAVSELAFDQCTDRWTFGTLRDYPKTRVRVNPADIGCRFFVLSGCWEHALTRTLQSEGNSRLLVDIGANYGYFSTLWLQRPGTSVISVEPVEEFVELLNDNLLRYGDRARIVYSCIGDYDGTALLDTFGGMHVLATVVSAATPTCREVRMQTLPSLLQQCDESFIDVLKVDAEGYDLQILWSAGELFRQHRVRAAFWETGPVEDNRPFEAFLVSCGYRQVLSGTMTGFRCGN